MIWKIHLVCLIDIQKCDFYLYTLEVFPYFLCLFSLCGPRMIYISLEVLPYFMLYDVLEVDPK